MSKLQRYKLMTLRAKFAENGNDEYIKADEAERAIGDIFLRLCDAEARIKELEEEINNRKKTLNQLTDVWQEQKSRIKGLESQLESANEICNNLRGVKKQLAEAEETIKETYLLLNSNKSKEARLIIEDYVAQKIL